MALFKESFRLSTEDASFLYVETPNAPLNMAMFALFKEPMSFKSLVKHIGDRMHLVPRYRQRVVFAPFNLAHPSLQDDPNFDLKNHVFRHQVRRGATQAAVMKAVMRIYEKPLDRGKPMWEVHLFNGLTGGHSGILTKLHHSLADGISGVDLLAVSTSIEPDAPPPSPAQGPYHPAQWPGRVELLGSALRGLLRSRVELGRRVYGAITQLGDFDLDVSAVAAIVQSIRRMAQPIVAAPWNAATVTRARTLKWIRVGMDEIARIRITFGGTVNDVALAMLSEGAARYLERHGCPIEGRPLRIGCPVNVRRQDEYGKLGNRVSMVFPEFDARPMNAVERLRAVVQETKWLKAAKEAMAFERLLAKLDYIPPAALGVVSRLVRTAIEGGGWLAGAAPGLARRAPSLGTGMNFVATNVPGPTMPIYFARDEIVEMVGMVPLTATLGYGVAIMSYHGVLYLGLMAEPKLMPDLGLMKSQVEEALGELLAAAPKPIVPQAPAPVAPLPEAVPAHKVA